MLKTLKLLEAIDIPPSERDAVRTFVYNVENGDAKNLAAVLKSLYGKQKAGDTRGVKPVAPTQPAAPASTRRPAVTAPAAPAQTGATVSQEGTEADIEGEVVFDVYEDINALIIKATPRSYLILLDTIKKLDIQPKQVLIEVLIAEITLTDETSLGLEWIFKGHGSVDGNPVDYIVGNAQKPTTYFQSTGSGDTATTDLTKFVPVVAGGLFANVIDSRNFNVFLNAAATLGNVNVLASPHILALDNKEAKIEIADEVPVATSISQAVSTTDLNTSQVQFKSAGVILTVTPHINEKKQVTLKINQEVSNPGQEYLIGGQAYQGFVKRSAITTAIVQDGHTLVIGGIISEKIDTSRNGIPFFSKLPLLGYLFGSTSDNMTRTELLLMVTPHVVANHEEADIITEEYKNKVKAVKEKMTERESRGPGARATVDQADVHLHDTDAGMKY
jgi:general secretion pathway protein D